MFLPLQVEEHFKQETKDYLGTIKRLQEENRKLSASLTAATERDRWDCIVGQAFPSYRTETDSHQSSLRVETAFLYKGEEGRGGGGVQQRENR
jgi:hypothetical protein